MKPQPTPIPTGRAKIIPLRARHPLPARVAPSPVRVVIVDDQSLVRSGVRLFLQLDSEIQVVGEAKNGDEAIVVARAQKPDVILMDVKMPDMDGVAATTAIRREIPTIEVIALSSSSDMRLVGTMIRAGAIGYLAKDTRAPDLCRAIHGAAIGQVQLAPEAAAGLMREMREPEVEPLSPRELTTLRLLAEGKTNKAIANDMVIGEKTVKTHVSNILAKLGVESRTQAALVAVERGLVAPREVNR